MPCGCRASQTRGRPPVEQVGTPSGRLGATHRPDEGARQRLGQFWRSQARCSTGVLGRPHLLHRRPAGELGPESVVNR